MILKNRIFERIAPSRDAKSIYIFCEGAKREKQYFQYFREIDSRINIEIYALDPEENNSPIGLLNIAKNCIVRSEDSENPKYEFIENLDEVWIVVDTDKDKLATREPQISEIVEFCNSNSNWFIAQSNPCFEVWLYYHKFNSKPNLTEDLLCPRWKNLVNESIPGGFNSKRHPYLINDAIQNAKNIFSSKNGIPEYACTNVYNLGESILPLVKGKLSKVFKAIEENRV